MTNTPKSRTFALADVLSALTGTLCGDVAGVYAVLNFLTGETLYTHQLPRAGRVAAPFIAAQHPDLAALDWSGVNPDTVRAWLATQIQAFGPTRELTPMPAGAYEAQHPIAELIQMRDEASGGRIVEG